MEKERSYLFSSESVSCGHPDKLADQISDAILDEFLRQDPESKVACETFITDGLVVVGGEVHSDAYVDIKSVVKSVLKEVGYTSEYGFDPENFGLITTIHEQSNDIRQGVDRNNEEEQGAGDQGMMFGYACNETSAYMPLTIVLAHTTMQVMDELRKGYIEDHRDASFSDYFGPDAKCQYTVAYDLDTHKPLRIDTIVISAQHKDEIKVSDIEEYVRDIVLPEVCERMGRYAYLFDDVDTNILVNPTGKFVIGGPKGDTGLTGRKIIVDTYGGSCPHGGGAFSGKDASKVDRTGAYAARFIAKNIVAGGFALKCTVQISYAIGVANPVSICIDTHGTGIYPDDILAYNVKSCIDLRPAAIIKRFGLKKPIFRETATYGHFGRDIFPWEQVDINFGHKLRKCCLVDKYNRRF